MNAFLDRLLTLPPPNERAYTGIRRFIGIPHSPAKQQKLANDVFYIYHLLFSHPLHALAGLCAVYMAALFFQIDIHLPILNIEYPDTGYIYYFADSFSFYGYYWALLAAIYPMAMLIKHVDFAKTNIVEELFKAQGKISRASLKTQLRFTGCAGVLIFLNPYFFPRIGGKAVEFFISHSPSLADPEMPGLLFVFIFYVVGTTAIVGIGCWLLFVFINSFLYKSAEKIG